MKNKIKMFATQNDTDKWAVCVDGYFGLFDHREEAEGVYRSIGGEDGPEGDELAGTGFGSSQILPPHFVPKFVDGYQIDVDKLSDHRAINIADYIRKAPTRIARRYQPPASTPQSRLEFKKFFAFPE